MRSCRYNNPYDQQDFDHPPTFHLVDGDDDLLGDSQLVLLPAYGHTPRYRSLWVRDG